VSVSVEAFAVDVAVDAPVRGRSMTSRVAVVALAPVTAPVNAVLAGTVRSPAVALVPVTDAARGCVRTRRVAVVSEVPGAAPANGWSKTSRVPAVALVAVIAPARGWVAAAAVGASTSAQ